MKHLITEQHLAYCTTKKQQAVITSLIKTQSITRTAEELGISVEAARKPYRVVTSRASEQGYSPDHDMNHAVPDSHYVKGVSTLYDDEGRVRMQWVKSDKRVEDALKYLHQIAEELKEEVPTSPSVTPPKHGHKELLNTYVVTDYHLGMAAWGEETKDEDWDTKKSEDLLVNWFAQAIALSPRAETAVFAQLGDFLHWDSMMPVTPTSGHILDADGKYQNTVRVAIKCITRITQMLLEKYPKVHLIMAEGNHDISSSIWLREMLAHYYSNEPRITVDVNPDPYYCVEHGETSLFFHHGHKRRPSNISSVFVAKFRDVFGRTKNSYAHMGHMHHTDIKENDLMIVEQHQTLSAKDSHCSRGGWHSGRSANVITYHNKYGEVSRLRLSPELIKGEQ